MRNARTTSWTYKSKQAFDGAREAMLKGQEERGGAEMLGGGGNVISRVILSQVCNDGEGGRRTIDGAAELGSSNIVNQHVFETQLAIFSRYKGAFHRERLDRERLAPLQTS